MNLCEKHRPKRLCDLRGQDHAVNALRSFIAKPYSAAFVFAGDTGTGKTSAAFALAREIGCDLDKPDMGGMSEIASGEQTADSVRKMLTRLSYRPFYGSGWKVLIVNECDRMNPAVETIWLDALEKLPPLTVIVFTTNNLASLSERFRDRCEVHQFESEFAKLRDSARSLVASIWAEETGQLVPPQIELSRVVMDGKLSFRRLVQLIAPMIRAIPA